MVRRARWGEDLTWVDGQWISTSDTALRAGSGAAAGPALVGTRASHHGVMFWSSFTGLAALAAVVWAAMDYAKQPVESDSMALGCLCVFGLALFTAVQTFSRRVLHDATGICDTTFFRRRRVPWKAIASLRRVNLNEAAQKRYDSQHKRPGSRPQNLMVWRISDAADREILHFSEAMSPPEAFMALRQRISAHLSTPDASWQFDNTAPGDASQLADTDDGLGAEHDAAFLPPPEFATPRKLAAKGNRSLLGALTLMVFPFAAATAYAVWRTLWFLIAAHASTGIVVEKSTQGVPSVVVAYAVADGRTLRKTSDGSDLYRDTALGNKIRVFYDPANPARARLDLFLELWITPLLLGALFLLVLLCAALIARTMTRPWPMAPPGLRGGKRR